MAGHPASGIRQGIKNPMQKPEVEVFFSDVELPHSDTILLIEESETSRPVLGTHGGFNCFQK